MKLKYVHKVSMWLAAWEAMCKSGAEIRTFCAAASQWVVGWAFEAEGRRGVAALHPQGHRRISLCLLDSAMVVISHGNRIQIPQSCKLHFEHFVPT